MEESVISWNLPNIVTVILMVMIIWILFGAVGHFVFRQGGKSAPSGGSQPFQSTPTIGELGSSGEFGSTYA